MKVACPFKLLHGNLEISTIVNNPNYILVGMCVIRHEALKAAISDLMSGHDMIKVLPKDYLSILIIQLRVAVRNGHVTLINPIVDMRGHGPPVIDSFDGIKDNPCVL